VPSLLGCPTILFGSLVFWFQIFLFFCRAECPTLLSIQRFVFGLGTETLLAHRFEQKRVKMDRKKIGTHSGSFHCDEALACFILLQTEEFANAEIVRTRDPAVIAQMDIVVDVGAVYDPDARRFDHHQRGFHDTLDADHKIKLSSAGLIYKFVEFFSFCLRVSGL
jgi:hypothetical protein